VKKGMTAGTAVSESGLQNGDKMEDIMENKAENNKENNKDNIEDVKAVTAGGTNEKYGGTAITESEMTRDGTGTVNVTEAPAEVAASGSDENLNAGSAPDSEETIVAGSTPADDSASADRAAQDGHDGGTSEEDQEKPGFRKGVLTGVLVTIGALLLIGVIVVGCLFRIYPQLRPYRNTNPSADERVDNSEKLDMERVSAKLEMLQQVVTDQFLFDMDSEQIEESIYKGYMEGLGDKYSQYYSAEEFEKLMTSMEGVFYGIGATVQKDPDTGVVSVVGVIDDSPAEKAGVKSGDIIYAVGDTLATDVDLDTLVYDLIRGEKDTDVTITFIRDGEQLDITITRGEVANTTVYCELMDDNIGFIEVSQFTDETVPQFMKAVDDMIKQGAKGLVIDLRNNGGGVLLGAVQMIDYLIPDGVKEHDGLIVYTADKDGIGERYYASDGHQVDIPIVLLVNEHSASASEVFTGALMDYDQATVVGNKTFGKGIVQTILPLDDGSAVKMTVEHYYTPDGTDLHGEGLTPDYEIELDEECKTYTDEHDNQYAKAVEIINSKTR